MIGKWTIFHAKSAKKEFFLAIIYYFTFKWSISAIIHLAMLMWQILRKLK